MADNQRNNARFAVSSSLVSMFDGNNNQLRLAGYDAAMQIGIWVPAISPEGKMTFPQENRHSLVLSHEVVATLDHIIKNQVLPAIENDRSFKKGVPANRAGTAIVEIIVQDGHVILQMNTNLDANKVAKETFQYEFAKDPVITGYNPTTGEFEVEMVDAQFALFCNTISMYTTVSTYGHGSKYQMDFSMSRMYQMLQAIATKLGVAINTGYSSGHSNNAGSGPASQPQYNGPINEAGDISALLA